MRHFLQVDRIWNDFNLQDILSNFFFSKISNSNRQARIIKLETSFFILINKYFKRRINYLIINNNKKKCKVKSEIFYLTIDLDY